MQVSGLLAVYLSIAQSDLGANLLDHPHLGRLRHVNTDLQSA